MLFLQILQLYQVFKLIKNNELSNVLYLNVLLSDNMRINVFAGNMHVQEYRQTRDHGGRDILL